MRNFYFFMLAVCIALCGCSSEVLDTNMGNLTMVIEDSGFSDKDASSYNSWIRVSEEGFYEQTYQTDLKYVTGQDTLLPTVRASEIKHIYNLKPVEKKALTEKTNGLIIVRNYQPEFVVCYTDFEVPVSFKTERAFLCSKDAELLMPVQEICYTLQDPILTKLEDEKEDEKEFYCYLLECSATAKTGEKISRSTTKVKVMIEKCVITFDPSVDPWEDADVDVDL